MSYITAKDFRKLSVLIELLTQQFDRKEIWLKQSEDGWDLHVSPPFGSQFKVHFTDQEISEMPGMLMMARVIDTLM